MLSHLLVLSELLRHAHPLHLQEPQLPLLLRMPVLLLLLVLVWRQLVVLVLPVSYTPLPCWHA